MIRYENGSNTLAILRGWPALQARLSKVNWSKVSERTLTLVTDHLCVLTGAEPSADAALDLLGAEESLPAHELRLTDLQAGTYQLPSPSSCLLVLSRGGQHEILRQAIIAFRRKNPQAKVLLLATRPTGLASVCHFGISPPAVEDLTSVGPGADLILLSLVALLGDWLKPGKFLVLCSTFSEKSLEAVIHKAFKPLSTLSPPGLLGKKGTIWGSAKSLGVARSLADVARRFSNRDWNALTLEHHQPDPTAFHLYLNGENTFLPERFADCQGLLIGGPQSQGGPQWGAATWLSRTPQSQFSLTLYQVGLDALWLWSLWTGSNPDHYFTSFAITAD